MNTINLVCRALILILYASVSAATAQVPATLDNFTVNESLTNLSELSMNITEPATAHVVISTNGDLTPINPSNLQNNTTQQTDKNKILDNSLSNTEKQASSNTYTDQVIVAYDPITKKVIIKNQNPDSPIPDDLRILNISKIKVLSGKNVKHVMTENQGNKLTDQTLSMIQSELGITNTAPSRMEVEFELDEIETLLNNNSVETVLKRYNITEKTSSASIIQHETENAVIVNLNNKSDGTWYRLTAEVPQDRGITSITVRYDDGSIRQISDWTRDGITVWFYDDPASVYEITTFKYEGTDTNEQIINFPAGGGSNGSVLIEIPRSANIVNMRFDINTSDTLTNLRLDVGANGNTEWGPVNFSSANGTFTLNNSNAGLVSAVNALIPQVDSNAVGVNYTYNTTSNNVTIELNFSSDSQGSLRLSNIYLNYTLWQNIYGNVSGSVKLSDGSNDLHGWTWATNEGNMYIIDIDSDINWSSLRSLGKKTDGSSGTADFIDLSQNLYMRPSYNISDAFSSDGATALDTTSFTIFGYTITDVPIVNSTDRNNHNSVSSADFITGILWDSSDDEGNNEYDTSDKEDIVFVTNINSGKVSDVVPSPHDYEYIIPSNFGSYTGTDGRITFYVELK